MLKAIRSKKQTVLCIDELDKADEATEYMLYEFFRLLLKGAFPGRL